MAAVFDFKKEFKDLYQPKTTPMMIQVPEMNFIMVDGKGDPNTCQAYQDATEVLYGLCYAIKMSKMGTWQPEGYFDFVVPPLEGFWWVEDEDFDGMNITDKNKFSWTSMIRQPDFVTREVYEIAQGELLRKKPGINLSATRLVRFAEGSCAQVMHLGSYDNEPKTIQALGEFIAASGFQTDITETRRHHEIYLLNPQKTPPEKLKTIIRHPIR